MKYVASYCEVRNLCHSLKNGNKHAVNVCANLLSNMVSANDTVIPMPSHNGYATYMFDVAEEVSNITGCNVANMLSSNAHEPWYETKKKNGIDSELGYEFDADETRDLTGNVYIIDNVWSTGKTMKAAIDKISNMFPDCNVDGIVIGYVDDKTIKELHYTKDLHEDTNMSNNIYVSYARRNYPQFLSLVINFLKNSEDDYLPMINGDRTNIRGELSLSMAKTGNGYVYRKDCEKPIVNIHLVENVLRCFLSLSDDYTSKFEYAKGFLEYVIRRTEIVEKDAQGNVKYVNGHPVGKKGKNVIRLGKTKSPQGKYYVHNLGTDRFNYGNTMDSMFDPQYAIVGSDGKITLKRACIGCGGRVQRHWVPKTGENSEEAIKTIAKVIVSTFVSTKNAKIIALFIAFLKGVESGEINEYQVETFGQKKNLLFTCDDIVQKELPQTTMESIIARTLHCYLNENIIR